MQEGKGFRLGVNKGMLSVHVYVLSVIIWEYNRIGRVLFDNLNFTLRSEVCISLILP